jgi:hypothetical protein
VLPVKDDIPTDRLPVLTLAFIVFGVAAGIAFGGAVVLWVLFVMLAWFAGPAVEGAMGRGHFLTFAFCSATIGWAVQLLLDGNDTQHALAAACGLATALAGAHLRLFPWARVQGVVLFPFFSTIVAVPLLAVAVVWVALEAVFALLGWAHVPVGAEAAGLFFGFVFARMLAQHVPSRDDLLQRGRARTT